MKNLGNSKLKMAVDSFIRDLNTFNPQENNIYSIRKDADFVNNENFYFFNIYLHRVFMQLDFEDNEATIIWTGTHDEYERVFKNNKHSIEKWLRKNGHIE